MAPDLALGTAQFGVDYGVSNRGVPTPPGEVTEILRRAWEAGCRILDTAALYGESEEVLGQVLAAGPRFRIVTKTPKFGGAVNAENAASELRASFQRSLRRLRRLTVYGLLAHDADDLLAPGGRILFEEMARLKDCGLVEKIGASVYEGAQVDALLDRFPVDLVQAPISVLDQRLVLGGHLARMAERGIEVHVRSAFLQGLLLTKPDQVPAYFGPVRDLLMGFRAGAIEAGLTPVEAALAFVKGLDGVDVVLVGVANLGQLEECLRAFARDAGFDAAPFACDDPRFVNPARWQL